MNEWENKYNNLAKAFREEVISGAEREYKQDDIHLLDVIDKLRRKNIQNELYIDHLETLVDYFVKGVDSDKTKVLS